MDKDLLDVYRQVNRCGDCGHITGFDWDMDAKTARELTIAGVAYGFFGNDIDWHFDEVDSQQNWLDMVAYMRERLSAKYPSFQYTDKWHRRGDGHVILENTFFQIVVIDNEWSAAWCLLEREDIDNCGSNRALMKRHYQTYLEAIKTTLIEGFGEAIGYGGAWTHGAVYKAVI